MADEGMIGARVWHPVYGPDHGYGTDDVECDRPAGHLTGDLPHRAHDPSGSGRVTTYDDAGRILEHTP